MIPDNLHIGPFPIHLFGLFVALAFLVAGEVARREFVRSGLDASIATTATVWALVGGLAGARLWLIVHEGFRVFSNPGAFLLTGGGFAWYGGLFGGTLAVSLYFRHRRVPWLRGADLFAPSLALGHAIGRIGCQVSGDGDWGVETTLPWGMAYPHAVVGWDKPPGVRVHPTPLYEFGAYLAIFLFLWAQRRNVAADGATFGRYLVLAGLARFLVEFVRVNPRVALGLSEAQWVSAALVAVGVWMLRRSPDTSSPAAGQA